MLRRGQTVGVILLTTIVLEGCAQKAIEVGFCGFTRRELSVEAPQSSSSLSFGERTRQIANVAADQPDAMARKHTMAQFMAVAPLAIAPGQAVEQGSPQPEPIIVQNSLADVISRTLDDRRNSRARNSADSMLFLSGGSQHGAYGAGFLYQWQQDRTDKKLPDFAVVTGISTGALLATYAFVSRTDLAVAGYTIHDEKELLKAHGHPSSTGGLGLGEYVGLLTKGAIADLGPLRTHLATNLPDDVLNAVATEGDKGRKLFVGAVNVDTGKAEAFDLTAMAQRWRNTPNAPGSKRRSRRSSADTKALLKNCYIEAIIASSSAPVAAPPSFIDNREYIDGGARFGVFSNELGAVITQKATRFQNQWSALLQSKSFGLQPEPPPVPVQYIIVNGTLTIPSRCATNIHCSTNPAGPASSVGDDYGTAPHIKWDILSLAARTGEDILPDSVYNLSVIDIEKEAALEKNLFKFTKIDVDADSFPTDINDPSSASGSQTCSAYQAQDKASQNPVQFFPKYMRCLIKYGEARAHTAVTQDNWDRNWKD